jgi:adenylate cyclase
MDETPRRVLVVDDQPQNLLLAEAVLKAVGFAVTKAADGHQCLTAVEAEPPDLILLDVMMPGMDGFEVCRRLKAHREYRYIPIVLLTALTASEDRVTGIEAGADDFISKPFNRHELIARVRSLVRVKRLEEQVRRHMRTTLERYLDSSVAQQMLENPELVTPGGRRVAASALFADIRGFTAWSEGVSAETAVEGVNLLLGQAVEIVFRHGGTVDKFTGDGLMAIFGAPVPHEDHARRAVAAALEIVAAGRAVRAPYLPEGFRVGCGVSTGEMVVGNIGSERRLDYTAIGDTVNTAARLCEEAEGGQVLVSAETWGLLDGAEGADLGERRMRKRAEPLRVMAVRALRQP